MRFYHLHWETTPFILPIIFKTIILTLTPFILQTHFGVLFKRSISSPDAADRGI